MVLLEEEKAIADTAFKLCDTMHDVILVDGNGAWLRTRGDMNLTFG